MCSIIGSFDAGTIQTLSELNAYRGTHSHSVYAFDCNYDVVYSHRDFGALDISQHDIPEDTYIVAHQQAPTTESRDSAAIHPAQNGTSLLWHNGIIKHDDVKRLQVEQKTDIAWDTKLLLNNFINTGSFDNINGTFACMMYHNEQLHILRNEISPLFMNDRGDVSSTKFAGSMSVSPNKVLTFTPFDDTLIRVTQTFMTKENPYYFT